MGYPRVSLYIEEWPEMDQRLWRGATRSGGFLEEQGAASRWSPKTTTQVGKDYGRFLGCLTNTGRLNATINPSQRLTKANLAVYLKHLQESGMASTSLLSRFRNLEAALRVMEPHAKIPLLKTLLARLKAQAEPRRSKIEHVVEPAILIDRSLEFYDDILRQGLPLTMLQACHARDALMLAVMASRPIRLANFTAISLGRNLIPTEDGYTLHLRDDETKEHHPYTCPIPDYLVPYLDHYLEVVRPSLLKEKTTERLWVSMRATGMSDSTVYYQIKKITKKLIGFAINPHLIRACVMTSIANHRPESVLAGARLLGHRSLETSEKHYNQANTLAASRQHVSIVQEMRGTRKGKQPSDDIVDLSDRST